MRPWLNSRFSISNENRSVWNWMKAGLIWCGGNSRTSQCIRQGVWAYVQGVTRCIQVFDTIRTLQRGMASHAVSVYQWCIPRKLWIIEKRRVDRSVICQDLRDRLQRQDKLLCNRTVGLQRWLCVGLEAGKGRNRMIVHHCRLTGRLVVPQQVDRVVYIKGSFVWRHAAAHKQHGWCKKEGSGHPPNVEGLS